MFKYYNKIDNYFIDKEQLKRYKNHQLLPNEVVILSNDNHESNLSINVDDFKATTIIFKDSKFKYLKLSNFNTMPSPTVKLDNCDVERGYMILNPNSEVFLNNCSADLLEISAKNININKLKSLNKYISPSNFKIGGEHTDKVSITDSKGLYDERLKFNIQSKKTYINNSRIRIKTNCNILLLNNSNITNDNSIVENYTIINNSNILYHPCNKILKCPTIFIYGKNGIVNSDIETNILSINKDSNLNISDAKININDELIMGTSSSLNCKNNSKLYTNEICFNPNSKLVSNEINFQNTDDVSIKIDPLELKNSRENIVKTLSLVREKYNKSLKDFKTRR